MAQIKPAGTVDVELTLAELELIRRGLQSLIDYGMQDDDRPARELLADLEVTA